MNKTNFELSGSVELKQSGTTIEVWKGGKLVASVREDENPHFAVWRVLNRLSEE